MQLTKLDMYAWDMVDSYLQQLPQSLQYVRLIGSNSGRSTDNTLQLQHLTNVVRLDLDGDGAELLTAPPVLPTQLQEHH